MGFRFRLGPFTFGRTDTRLSLWRGGIGFSTPLSGTSRTFGKVGAGPLRTTVTNRGFRFGLGPFTFGRTGTRLSLWRGGIGLSIPLSGKGRTFGKVGVGPLSWYGQSGKNPSALPSEEAAAVEPNPFSAHEGVVIDALRADQRFLERLQQQGMPWRGIQERLKEELPHHIPDLDHIAYRLVPKAMNITFGQQETAWRTEKRPSKRGTGFTTWIVVK